MNAHDEGGDSKPSRSTKPDAKATNKKSYRSPKLVIYGDIRAITQMIGNMGMDDGGGVGNMKRTAV